MAAPPPEQKKSPEKKPEEKPKKKVKTQKGKHGTGCVMDIPEEKEEEKPKEEKPPEKPPEKTPQKKQHTVVPIEDDYGPKKEKVRFLFIMWRVSG